ncbi:ABC transporter substrate-binding protein [Elioraea rosea]|uniref:ABC transporter substrate-binding protein n=1 Tax=Elioraea rosea TaxID=2492390 RepID=UPI001183E8F8|nr:extracellular solute-binding protein [Elioraea rosea]
MTGTPRPGVQRRGLLAAAGAAALSAPALAQGAPRVARVWGEPGPYGGVFVQGMNEWAQRNNANVRFEVEQIPWDGVTVKLTTDLAARRPPALISVESPIAYQLAAEGLLEPVDDVCQRINARQRLVDGFTLESFGAWKGTQYAVPVHHQACLLVVQKNLIDELGLGDPASWNWDSFANAAKAIAEKKPGMAGYTMALGRNLCADYHITQFVWQANGMTWDPSASFRTVFNGGGTVEAFDYIRRLFSYMPRSAVEFSFLQVVDQHVTGRTGMSAYWGRTMGRAAEEAKPIFDGMEYYLNPAHPSTGMRWSWTDINGWIIPRRDNPFVAETKEAVTYVSNNVDWMVQYSQSLMPNVGPVFKDVATAPSMLAHPFYQSKGRSLDVIFTESVPHQCNTGYELKKGINPLAGIAHGRSVWAQAVQRMLLNNETPRQAADWGQRQFEAIRSDNARLIAG